MRSIVQLIYDIRYFQKNYVMSENLEHLYLEFEFFFKFKQAINFYV